MKTIEKTLPLFSKVIRNKGEGELFVLQAQSEGLCLEFKIKGDGVTTFKEFFWENWNKDNKSSFFCLFTILLDLIVCKIY